MRLTKTIRDAFIRAAMQDVPTVNYNEEARKFAEQAMIEHAPPEIQEIIKKKGKALDYLNRHYICTPGGLSNFSVYAPDGCYGYYARDNVPELWTKLEEYADKLRAQSQVLDELRGKLYSAAYACANRKQLVELLPEFEKYLPPDEPAAIKTLPAVANLVSDFIHAGWPKSAEVSA